MNVPFVGGGGGGGETFYGLKIMVFHKFFVFKGLML